MAQFPIAEAAIEALGIRLWPMVAFEADDAIATAVARWADDPAVEQVVICSPDKDMAQCVRDERVVLLDRRRRITYDEDGVDREVGRPPASIPDLLALVGDAADGYPGLPGWGAKSAAAVLRRYGSLEAIPARASDWDVPVRAAADARRDAPRPARRGVPVPDAGPPPDRRAAARDDRRRAALAGRPAGPLAGVLRRDRPGPAPLAAPPLAGRRTRRPDVRPGAADELQEPGVVRRRGGDDAERPGAAGEVEPRAAGGVGQDRPRRARR